MKHGKAGMNNFLGCIASYEKMQTCKVTYQNLEAWQNRYEALNIVVWLAMKIFRHGKYHMNLDKYGKNDQRSRNDKKVDQRIVSK